MEDRSSSSGLAVTRDHHVPKSRGGRTVVLACRDCNSIKGDMMPDDWSAFMESFPRWWERPELAGRSAPQVYATAWSESGTPVLRAQKKKRVRKAVPGPGKKATKNETEVAYAEWQAKCRRERKREAQGFPYAESVMILRHGKDYWRAWKDGGGPICDCCNSVQPKAVPIAYDDPKQQAAFEQVYKNRLHLLRLPGSQA